MVGFSFSFPTKQASIASGTLIEQGKGYANPGAIGSDPVAHLTAAFKRQVRLQWVVRRAVLVVGYALPIVSRRNSTTSLSRPPSPQALL